MNVVMHFMYTNLILFYYHYKLVLSLSYFELINAFLFVIIIICIYYPTVWVVFLVWQAMAISEQIGYPDHILDEEKIRNWTRIHTRMETLTSKPTQISHIHSRMMAAQTETHPCDLIGLSVCSQLNSVRRTTLRTFWKTWQLQRRKAIRSWGSRGSDMYETYININTV